MVHIVRYFFVCLVTAIITLFVVDFQAVVDGFAGLIDGLSGVLAPIKGAVK